MAKLSNSAPVRTPEMRDEQRVLPALGAKRQHTRLRVRRPVAAFGSWQRDCQPKESGDKSPHSKAVLAPRTGRAENEPVPGEGTLCCPARGGERSAPFARADRASPSYCRGKRLLRRVSIAAGSGWPVQHRQTGLRQDLGPGLFGGLLGEVGIGIRLRASVRFVRVSVRVAMFCRGSSSGRPPNRPRSDGLPGTSPGRRSGWPRVESVSRAAVAAGGEHVHQAARASQVSPC